MRVMLFKKYVGAKSFEEDLIIEIKSADSVFSSLRLRW